MNKTILKTILFSNLYIWDIKQLENQKTYTSKYKMETFNDVLNDSDIEWVNIGNECSYPILGVRAYGKGVYLNRIAKGHELTMRKYQKSKVNHLFWCKVRTVHGQFGIVTDEFEDTFASSNMQYMEINKKKINPTYLQLLFNENKLTNYMDTLAIGADGRHFNKSTLLNVKIPLPDIGTQNKLVSRYNELIRQADEADKEATKLEDEIDRYLIDHLGIEEEILIKNTSRLIQFTNFKSIVQWGYDKIEQEKTIYNKKYPTKKIESICDVGSGGTPSRDNEEYYDGNISWIKTGEVVDEIILSTEEKISDNAIKNSSAKIYPVNSLIIAMYGQGKTRGRTGKLGIASATNQACAVLHNIDKLTVETDYLWIYLQGEYTRLRKLAYGNNQPNLNADMIKKYPVIIPPMEVQKEIVTTIFEMKTKIKELKIKATGLRNQAKKEFEEDIFDE